MEQNIKVFSSDIVRTNSFKNNLNDLLELVPAKPSQAINAPIAVSCSFIPKTDTYYISKKKSKLKVKTVRNIREVFEKDVLDDLYTELEKTRNSLMRKIRIGSSREEATKKMARIILRSDTPVSRDVWQMLTNLNPEGNLHSAQFVLWNRKYIQINGSRGGKNKFISSFDIGENCIKRLNKINFKTRKIFQNKTKLLHQSLNIKFRPGPLSKKKNLDYSYQKHQYGTTKIVPLPKAGLDVQPTLGIPIAPSMTKFLTENFMHTTDGKLTEKWANFSVSILGTNNKGCPVQSDKSSCISFDLEYKCKQNRILMRNALDETSLLDTEEITRESNNQSDDIEVVMNKILDYVEIKIETESRCYIEENDIRENFIEGNTKFGSNLKDNKNKRKFGELGRLDVTVIKLPGQDSDNSCIKCSKEYCSLGCICDSLECSYKLKTHCGRQDCMFECKCATTKKGFQDSSHNILSLSNLDDLSMQLKSGLAKEEQKFRQTVILSGEKSILLKSQRRDWKSSKKYADFFSNMCLKTETKCKNLLYIVSPKIDCSNIEPWCMVHNLYRCFCKGKFTERATMAETIVPDSINEVDTNVVDKKLNPDQTQESLKQRLRTRVQQENDAANAASEDVVDVSSSIKILSINASSNEYNTCARLEPYNGRKYSDEYYSVTNNKILEMEKNDKSLIKKMTCLLQKSHENSQEKNHETSSLKQQHLSFKTKLYLWIESSYKCYKECQEKGIILKSLEPPKESKWSFYSWEFILSRYKEGKNLFLVTSGKPFKIYLAVNQKHPKLATCINIKDITSVNLQEYPFTVKNLVTQASHLKDTFCVLRGLSYCWEFIGTVTKVGDLKKVQDNEKFSLDCNSVSVSDEEPLNVSKIESSDAKENMDLPQLPQITNVESLKNEPQSKWFVMTVEKDFNEIHFYKKGFFVKYDSVIRAINVSRLTNKTVRLSSQKCNNGTDNPQFGLYAIPNKDDLNVFVGPYEKEEPLGIETVKTELPTFNGKRSRGTWIFVNKMDNVKIIDQSLSFLPNIESKEMFLIDNSDSSIINDKIEPTCKKPPVVSTINEHETTTSPIKKTVKPIKIRKSDGFYQLYTKQLNSSKLSPRTFKVVPKLTSTSQLKNNDHKLSGASETEKQNALSVRPVAEIAPQIKIQVQKPLEGNTASIKLPMSILDPVEINKRSLLDQISAGPSSSIKEPKDDIDADIEKFLAVSPVCTVPNAEVLVISDEEDQQDVIKNVWLQAKNVLNLGWIPAKLNANNEISFQFPGFKFSEFYSEQTAFHKLNLVFSRKVFVPKSFQIKWEVIETAGELKTKRKLVQNDLKVDLVVTKKGLKSRAEVMKLLKVKNDSTDTQSSIEGCKKKLLAALDNYASSDDNDNNKLCIEDISKKSDILLSISKATGDRRKEISERLSSLLMDSKNCN